MKRNTYIHVHLWRKITITSASRQRYWMIWTAREAQQSDPYVVLHVQYIDSVDKRNDQ